MKISFKYTPSKADTHTDAFSQQHRSKIHTVHAGCLASQDVGWAIKWCHSVTDAAGNSGSVANAHHPHLTASCRDPCPPETYPGLCLKSANHSSAGGPRFHMPMQSVDQRAIPAVQEVPGFQRCAQTIAFPLAFLALEPLSDHHRATHTYSHHNHRQAQFVWLSHIAKAQAA